METRVFDGPAEVGRAAADVVAGEARATPELRLILPTGHTPLPMYAELRRRAAAGSLPTGRTTLFQLDEYCGLRADDPRSYRAYLRRELEGVPFAIRHELAGDAPDLEAECRRYERLLDERPIDLVVLGLGRDGHVAFDEPGSGVDDGARVVALAPQTRADAAADFGGLGQVPTRAVTVGLRTVRAARRVVMLVTGANKAEALRRTVEGPETADWPASRVRDLPGFELLADRAAAR